MASPEMFLSKRHRSNIYSKLNQSDEAFMGNSMEHMDVNENEAEPKTHEQLHINGNTNSDKLSGIRKIKRSIPSRVKDARDVVTLLEVDIAQATDEHSLFTLQLVFFLDSPGCNAQIRLWLSVCWC